MDRKTGRLPHTQASNPPPGMWLASGAQIPAKLDRSAIPFVQKIYYNNLYGNCSFANTANIAEAWYWVKNNCARVTDEDVVLQSFCNFLGIPNNPAALLATDGAAMADVWKWIETHGFDVGEQVPLVCEPKSLRIDRTTLADAMNTHAAAGLGVDLYAADMTAKAWLSIANPGDLAGGHWCYAFDYTGLTDSDTVRVGTWAEWMETSWPWIEARTQEAYALIWSN